MHVSVGQKVDVVPVGEGVGFHKRHPELNGPFEVVGTHPKNFTGQLACIRLSNITGDVIVINSDALLLST